MNEGMEEIERVKEHHKEDKRSRGKRQIQTERQCVIEIKNDIDREEKCQ